ncbi:MAG: M48 family metallopeptidase [Betaproteobacteria bacterium]|nr:M48 family metallopeptidase [Betaproteobacteria bacterium]MDH3437650.1 M48 family metallopeptidase [Betaproteobacteria bacterium]
MKYVSKAPPSDDINVSPEHPLKEAAILISGLTAVFTLLAAALIFFVDLVVFFVPPETEARLFASWWPIDLYSTEAEDPRASATRALLERLARHWPDSAYTFRLGVMEDDSPNAMALPGGLIVVTTGLLDRVGTENELAFVLGHELGHFQNRDHIQALGRGIALSMMVAAIGSGDGGGALGLTVADLTLRGFSRAQEGAADRFGLEIVQREYEHVNESWGFFDRLLEEDATSRDLLIYLSTHPSADDRIATLKAYARERDWPLTGPTALPAWQAAHED